MYKENRRQNCLLISHNHITVCRNLFVYGGRFPRKRGNLFLEAKKNVEQEKHKQQVHKTTTVG